MPCRNKALSASHQSRGLRGSLIPAELVPPIVVYFEIVRLKTVSMRDSKVGRTISHCWKDFVHSFILLQLDCISHLDVEIKKPDMVSTIALESKDLRKVLPSLPTYVVDCGFEFWIFLKQRNRSSTTSSSAKSLRVRMAFQYSNVKAGSHLGAVCNPE